MKSGSPPTARKARTGLLTPPGNSPRARASSFRDFAVFMAREGVARPQEEGSAAANPTLGSVDRDLLGGRGGSELPPCRGAEGAGSKSVASLAERSTGANQWVEARPLRARPRSKTAER